MFHHTDGGYVVATDPLWAQPNTIPMLRADTRRIYDASGVAYGQSGDNGSGQYLADSDEWAETLALRVKWFRDQTAATYAAAGKDFAWSMMIEGPDGGADDGVFSSQLRLMRHADDEIIAGHAVAGVNGRGSPFPEAGIAQCAAWFAVASARLDYWLGVHGLPDPVFIWANIESRGDTTGSSFIDDGEGGYTAGIWDTALAKPQANTYKIDGVHTLAEWAAARTTRPDGSPYPAFGESGGNPYNVANFDQVQRCNAMIATSFYRALDQGIFTHFRAYFPGVKTAEWSTQSDSREFPVFASSLERSYDMGGFMPLSGACPIMYSQPDYVDGSGVGSWGTNLSDWVDRYGVASPTSLQYIRAGRAQIKERCADIDSATGKQTFPSFSLGVYGYTNWTDVPDALRLAVKHEMAAAIADCGDHENGPGVTDVYVFAPAYSTDADLRSDWNAIAAFVHANTTDMTPARSSLMGLSFEKPTYAEMIASLDPIYHARFGKSTVTNIVGAGSTVYAGTPEHGRRCNIAAEALDADNVGSRFVNATTTPTNYIALGTVLGTLGSTFYPVGGPAKTWALRVRFRMNATARTAILGNQDANNGLLIWGGSSKGWLADTNMCQAMIKRDGSNYLSIAVNTSGAHANGEWHTLDLHFDHINNHWTLIFDDGVASTTTALTNDNTTNPWTISGTLAAFGNFNTSLYAAAHWTGSAVSQSAANTDIEIAEIQVFVGSASTANGSPSPRALRSLGHRALGFEKSGVYFADSVSTFFSRAKTQHGAMLVYGDSQTTQAKERLAWLGTMNLNFKDSIGVAGTWAAAMPAHQGSFVTSYDGVGRGGISNGTAYASQHADVKALVPDTNMAVTDPDVAGNNAFVSCVGAPWVLADGATVANSNGSTWVWTVAEAPFNAAAELKLHLRILGSTTGSGTGVMNVVLKNGSDILCADTITCKGPAPSGARTSGTWWEADHVLTIPAGTRASATYTLYGARSELGGSGGSAGPCGISFAQIALATPVGVSSGVLAAEGGRSMRYTNRQLEDLGVSRLSAILRAAAQPAIVAGQIPNICLFVAHGFNDINDTNNSIPPDGTFTATASNRYSGIYQNFEWFLRQIDAAVSALGWTSANVSVMVGYHPSAQDEWYMHNTYAAMYKVAKDRRADTTKVQVCVVPMPELFRHADEYSATAPARNFPINDTTHPTRSGFLEFFRGALTPVYRAVSQNAGESSSSSSGSGGGRVNRVSRPTLT